MMSLDTEMLFGEHYLYLVNFVGKGILYLDFWEKILDFNSILKEDKINYVTKTTKQSHVSFTYTTSSS